MTDGTPPRRTGELRERQAEDVPSRTERSPLRHESAQSEDQPERSERSRDTSRRARVEERRHVREPRGEAPRSERRAEAEAAEPRGRGREEPARSREARGRGDPPAPEERHSRSRRARRASRTERRDRNVPSRTAREQPTESKLSPARPRERVAEARGREHVGELPTAEAVERRPAGGEERARLERSHREETHGGREEVPSSRVPPVDVVDAPDEVTVVCDLPGCDPEQIELRGSAESLRIEAERDGEVETDALDRQERPRSVTRTVDLPARTDVEAAEASYEDGVLRVTLPKREASRERTIGIE